MSSDIENQDLFHSENNAVACSIMVESGIPVDSYFCIPSYLAETPRNGNTEPVRMFLEHVAKENLIDDFILVGPKSFRFTIGKGSNPDSKSLIGNPVFPTLVRHKRTLTLPDTDSMIENPQADYYERRVAKDALEKFKAACLKVAPLLRR